MRKFGLTALALAAFAWAGASQAANITITLEQQAPGSALWDVLLNSDTTQADGTFGVYAGLGSSFAPGSSCDGTNVLCASTPGTAFAFLDDQTIYLAFAGTNDAVTIPSIGTFPVGLGNPLVTQPQNLGTITSTGPGGALLALGNYAFTTCPGAGSTATGCPITIDQVFALNGTNPIAEWGDFSGTARSNATYIINGEVVGIPEPGISLLLGLGLTSLAFLRRGTV